MLPRDQDQTDSTAQQPSPATAQCIILAPPATGIPADLATALARRGASVEVAFDALQAMAQLGQWHLESRARANQEPDESVVPRSRQVRGTILLIVEFEDVQQAEELCESVGVFYPWITVATFGGAAGTHITIRHKARVAEPTGSSSMFGPSELPEVHSITPGRAPTRHRPVMTSPSLRLVRDSEESTQRPDKTIQEDAQDEAGDIGEPLITEEELSMLLADEEDVDFANVQSDGSGESPRRRR